MKPTADNSHPIYLDFNATTPLDPRVFEAMLPYFHENFGNSVSAAHSLGWSAEKAVKKAREQVAQLLHCEPHEIFFTSGATESNNWVIKGLYNQLCNESPLQDLHFISSRLEHSSVANSLKAVENLSANRPHLKISWIDNESDGTLSLKSLESALKTQAQLMSFMWINNEIGSINPMKTLADLAKSHQTYLHTDATQALGKVQVDVQEVPVDLLSFSAHKIYGPKGIGALYIRSKNPKVQIQPLLHGGGHEKGQRSGTLNVPAIVGLGVACTLIKENFTTETLKLKTLRDSLWTQIQEAFPSARLNGPSLNTAINSNALNNRAVNNLNISFLGMHVPPSFADIAISRGSACHSGATSISPVLQAIGVSDNEADKTLRFSLGRQTTAEEIHRAVATLKKTLRRL